MIEEKSMSKFKRVSEPKLIAYGFIKANDCYRYDIPVLNGQFLLSVGISDDGRVNTRLWDTLSDAEYVLHRAAGAVGKFSARVRAEYSAILCDIADKCFVSDVFKSSQTRDVIEYAAKTYSDSPEYLWRTSPNNAVLRRKDTGKWYAALLTLSRSKLGLDSADTAEIIDLRGKPEEIAAFTDGVKYFPGWHMNKKSWYTVILDGSVTNDQLFRRIDISYRLAIK